MSDKKTEQVYKYRPLFSYWKEITDSKTGEIIKKEKVNKPILNKFALNLLTKGELYFSSPRDFNDPFDCWIPVFPSIITEEFVKKKKKEDSNFKEYILNQFNRDIASFVMFHNDPMIDYDLKTRIHRESLDDNLICCFSKNFNNVIMWSHYADSNQGICLGLKVRDKSKVKYLDLISEKGKVELPIEYVNYSLDGKKKMPIPANKMEDDLIKNNSYLKAKEWAYEKEVRAIITKEEVGSKVLKLRKNSIKEFYFGINVPNKIIIETMKIIHDSKYFNFKNIKFYKIKDCIGYYRLDFQEIKKDCFYTSYPKIENLIIE